MTDEPRPVMVVEDDFDIRVTLGELIEAIGYPVVLASSGQEAIEHLKGTTVLPQVILLDLMMPVMNGWEFCAEQQKNPEWDSIPVVIISAGDQSRTNLDGIKVKAYLRKPLQLQSVTGLLEQVYNR